MKKFLLRTKRTGGCGKIRGIDNNSISLYHIENNRSNTRSIKDVKRKTE